MHVGKLVFAQLMEHLPWKTFGRIVERYDGDRRVREFSCANQFRWKYPDFCVLRRVEEPLVCRR